MAHPFEMDSPTPTKSQIPSSLSKKVCSLFEILKFAIFVSGHSALFLKIFTETKAFESFAQTATFLEVKIFAKCRESGFGQLYSIS
jgi:hypothetical protein